MGCQLPAGPVAAKSSSLSSAGQKTINLVTKKKGWPRQHPSNPSGRPGPMGWKQYHTLCEITYANLQPVPKCL